MKRAMLSMLAFFAMPVYSMAASHGPVFGLATPTNSQGEYSFDFGMYGRSSNSGSQASFRALIGYGFTPHLTLSFTAPVAVGDAILPPTRIQPGTDFESTLAWRFHHNATKIGTRFESTAFAGLVVPGAQSGFNGVVITTNAPGSMVGVVTGMASRSHYLWLGTTFTKFTVWFTATAHLHGANHQTNGIGASLVSLSASVPIVSSRGMPPSPIRKHTKYSLVLLRSESIGTTRSVSVCSFPFIRRSVRSSPRNMCALR
jgi:hypothetical protein